MYYVHDFAVSFLYFDGTSLYFLIVRIWYIWFIWLLLSAVIVLFVTCKYWIYYNINGEVSIIDFFLHMWNHVTLQDFWSHLIYQLFRYTCALLMKFPLLTCLKIFVSNTLFTSSLKNLNISTFSLFLIWNIISFIYRKKY